MAAVRTLAPPLLAGLAVAACVEAPPPLPTVARIVSAPMPPPPPAARWVESGGTTMVGPSTTRGTLVLLGGRRALVTPDGAVEPEKTAAPEPLVEIVSVPTPAGPRIVARGANGVYRFDDPLGPAATLARSDRRFTRIGAGPGTIAVWTERSSRPRFLDVETGALRARAALPDLPLRAVAFVDDKRGAAVFEVTGLAVTLDGGSSWRPAQSRGAGQALLVSGLRRRGDAVRAFAFAEGPDAAVDLDAARLGPMDPPAAAPSEPALVRWIRVTSRDPLEAIAAGGVDLPSGAALVASHGLLARVDPKAGAIGELVELSHGQWVPCSAARAGGIAWVACSMPPAEGRDDLFDPFGIMRVRLGEPRLVPERPALVRNGEAELRVSPSGGALLDGPCKIDDQGEVCVKQPDGAWRTIHVGVELHERGPGALADGRVAFLRGVFEGDVAPDSARSDEDGPPSSKLHVALVGVNGKERALAAIPFTPSRGNVRVQSPIEEESDKTLHFVIEDGEGPHSVIVYPGRETPLVQRVPDATEARLHAGRGIAVGEGRVLVSLDGGASWSEAPAPPSAREAARAIATGAEPADTLSVSEIGARVGSVLRLGWGPPEGDASAGAGPDRPATGPLLPAPAAPAAAPARTLRCADAGAGSGVPPLLGSAEARALLARKELPGKTKKRDPHVWAARIGSMETVALMDDEAPPGGRPTAWSFRWHDPREIGGRVRSATVKIPPSASGSTSLRFAASNGGRALFALRSAGNKTRLVRVRPSGAPEIAEVPHTLAPSGQVVFGTSRGEPIAWLHDRRVVVWVAGEKPRTIAEIASHAARSLGAPTAAGVPLLVGASDWALARVLPIPKLDKASPDKAPPPVQVPLDGWSRLPSLARPLASLAVCGARPDGLRFSLKRAALRAEIDGVGETASTALYDVRVTGEEACVEGISAMLVRDRRASTKGAASASFVRADLVGKKAEGGDRGLAPDARVRRLKCALSGEG